MAYKPINCKSIGSSLLSITIREHIIAFKRNISISSAVCRKYSYKRKVKQIFNRNKHIIEVIYFYESVTNQFYELSTKL